MNFPRCPSCGKVIGNNAGLCKRAARNLTTNSRNEKRIFVAKRCKWRGCPNPSWIVATAGIVNARIRRKHMHDEQEREDYEEEIQEVIATIYNDVLEYATSPEDFFPFLQDCYGTEIANRVISELIGALE